MIVDYNKNYYDTVLSLMKEFYNSSAVLHSVPEANMQYTLQHYDSPYIDLLVIVHEEQVAGYVQLSLTHSTEAGGLVVLIEEVYVSPQFQGKGLGTMALKYILDKYQHASRFYLEVCASNTGAISLYKRLGFERLPYEQYILEPVK